MDDKIDKLREAAVVSWPGPHREAPHTIEVAGYSGPDGTIAAVGERDHRLSEAARRAIEHGVPENTRRAYTKRWADFELWCDHELRGALPATRETLAEYVHAVTTNPTQRGEAIAPTSVEQIIATIRTVHREAGYDGQPATIDALRVLRGYKRDRGARPKAARPITIMDLHAMSSRTSRHTAAGLRDRAILVLGWALAARRSELCALAVGDVVEVEDGLEVFVRTSKTDKQSEGHTVRIVRGSYSDTDPVRVVAEWKAELSQYGVTDEEYLFRGLDRWGNLRPSLSPRYVTDIVQAAARRAMLPFPESYSAHSLRAGFATVAAEKGVPARAIADHGRWSPTSTVVNSYMRAADAWRNNPTRAIGL